MCVATSQSALRALVKLALVPVEGMVSGRMPSAQRRIPAVSLAQSSEERLWLSLVW